MESKITPYRFCIDLSAAGRNLRIWIENIDTANAMMELLGKTPGVGFAELWDSQEHRMKRRLHSGSVT